MRNINTTPDDKRIYFANATGNSFIIIDLMDGLPLEQVRLQVINQLIAEKKDSILAFEKLEPDVYRMRVIEKDGAESSFCGNGARVFMHYLNHRTHVQQAYLLTISNKQIRCGKVEDAFFVECGKPNILPVVEFEGLSFHQYYVCGEPHLITDAFFDAEQLTSIARKIRQSLSINVSCIHNQKILTYERGVEEITQSCGTACVAATQFRLTVTNIVNDRFSWHCPGGINQVDPQTFSLYGPTVIEF